MPNTEFDTWIWGSGCESTLWVFLVQTALPLGVSSVFLSVKQLERLIPPGHRIFLMVHKGALEAVTSTLEFIVIASVSE